MPSETDADKTSLLIRAPRFAQGATGPIGPTSDRRAPALLGILTFIVSVGVGTVRSSVDAGRRDIVYRVLVSNLVEKHIPQVACRPPGFSFALAGSYALLGKGLIFLAVLFGLIAACLILGQAAFFPDARLMSPAFPLLMAPAVSAGTSHCDTTDVCHRNRRNS